MACAAAAAGTKASAPAAMAAGHGTIEDMPHTLHLEFPIYFGESLFSVEQVFNFAEHRFNLCKYSVNEHTGTHVGAQVTSNDIKAMDGNTW